MPLIHGNLKRTILERIRTLDLGDDVQVEPVMPVEIDRQCVYLNPARWISSEPLAERGLIQQQTITIEVRIRVEAPGGDIFESETVAEGIQSRLVSGVLAEPFLLGGMGTLEATSGDADPTVISPDPDPKVIVNLGVTFTAVVNVAVH